MPDSLRGSLDVEHAAPAEIEAKIREIRAVLRGGGESLSVADRLLRDRECDHLEDQRFKVRNGVDEEPPVVLNGSVSWDNQNVSPLGRMISFVVTKRW